jgi:hypothetical protein
VAEQLQRRDLVKPLPVNREQAPGKVGSESIQNTFIVHAGFLLGNGSKYNAVYDV